MTLILGLIAQDGLVLISDSQVTFTSGTQPFRSEAQKIFPFWRNVAWGGSGHTGIVQQVGQHLTLSFSDPEYFVNKTRQQIRQELSIKVAEKVRELIGQALQVQGVQPLLTTHLFVGYASDGPFILEVHHDLTHSDHTEIGHAAIGSAEIFPYVVLAGLKHFNVRKRTLKEAKLVAYRVMQDAISVAAFGIGTPIQVIEITATVSGPVTVRLLNDDDTKVIRDAIEQWKLVESDALSQFVGVTKESPGTN